MRPVLSGVLYIASAFKAYATSCMEAVSACRIWAFSENWRCQSSAMIVEFSNTFTLNGSLHSVWHVTQFITWYNIVYSMYNLKKKNISKT